MKEYEAPSAQVVTFDEDVITASGAVHTGGSND